MITNHGDRSFGNISDVIKYIGTLISRLNVKLKDAGERQILLANITKDLNLTEDSIDEVLKDNILVLVSLEVREPSSIDKTPFGLNKNWNLHGLTFEQEDSLGNYSETKHVYRYDNMLVFYVLGKNYTEVIDDSLYIQNIIDELTGFVSRHVAERMFFYECIKNTTGRVDSFGTRNLSKYEALGLDYFGIAYFVRTQRIKYEINDIIKTISGEVFIVDDDIVV